jgi:isopenicillin-N N-acyltransferase-like protein
MKTVLLGAPVTSGHNYLLSTLQGGEHWEVSPDAQEMVAQLRPGEEGVIFHTNHCLGEKNSALENKDSMSSTTFNRFELLQKKAGDLRSCKDLKALLQNHEGYPKSICSHFESGVLDPSMTCGGAVADLKELTFSFWRGCPTYDQNYLEHNFVFEDNRFKRVGS